VGGLRSNKDVADDRLQAIECRILLLRAVDRYTERHHEDNAPAGGSRMSGFVPSSASAPALGGMRFAPGGSLHTVTPAPEEPAKPQPNPQVHSFAPYQPC
jgi:hypothetical protein